MARTKQAPAVMVCCPHSIQSRVLETFDVEEKQGSYLEQRYGNVTVLSAHVTSLIHKEKVRQCGS